MNWDLNEQDSQWAWESVVQSGRRYGQKRGQILRQEIYDCAFCKGTGERPRGSKCPVCKGKGRVHLKPPAVVCAFCKGTGEEKPRSTITCSACRGKGVVSVKEPIRICPTCSGRGKQIGSALYCIGCKGTGVVTTKTGKKGDSVAMARRPAGSEWEALQIIHNLGSAGRNGVGGRMHVSAYYADYVLKSLLNRQLIQRRDRDIYVLSQAGKNIFEKMEAEKSKDEERKVEEKKTEEKLEKVNIENLQEYKMS